MASHRPLLLDEAFLLLRGWFDEQSSLRVSVQSPEVWFAGFCTIFKIEGENVIFSIGTLSDNNSIGFSLAGCRFRFGDVPSDAPDSTLPTGGQVESGIIGTRRDFEIAILLLRQHVI
jgi:hypothetical protein